MQEGQTNSTHIIPAKDEIYQQLPNRASNRAIIAIIQTADTTIPHHRDATAQRAVDVYARARKANTDPALTIETPGKPTHAMHTQHNTAHQRLEATDPKVLHSPAHTASQHNTHTCHTQTHARPPQEMALT